LIYAIKIGSDLTGAPVLTRRHPSLAYQVLLNELPAVRSGHIQVLGYACIPGEVATFVLAPGVPSFNVMGAFIGSKGVNIARLSRLASVRFNLIEYVEDPNELLRVLIPGFRNAGGQLLVDREHKVVVAVVPEKTQTKITNKYAHLAALYEEVTGLSLYFSTPERRDLLLEEVRSGLLRKPRRRRLKVFVSYKWEDAAHNEWVETLARNLRRNGIEAILDRWEVRLGDSFTDYMTSRIGSADVILFIITTRSVAVVEAPPSEGGALKFEMQMATARRTAGENMRLIGIYREGLRPPAHLRDHRYADFRDDSRYAENLRDLIDDLYERRGAPPVL
jgi:transcription antitermination factor NusA-like protein